MDQAFELVYKVERVFKGDAKDKINFIGFYHYTGLPRYTNHGMALLHLKPNHKDQLLLVNLKSLQILEDDEYDYNLLVHCEQWTDEGECRKSINASDLAARWQES